MNYYFDTSALIKRYIDEDGSERVETLFEQADSICVSFVTKIECISTLRRLLLEGLLDQSNYTALKAEVVEDFEYFTVVDNTEFIQNLCIQLIDKHQLKTLDSIQLACAVEIRNQLDLFVVSDKKLKERCEFEQFEVFDPTNFPL